MGFDLTKNVPENARNLVYNGLEITNWHSPANEFEEKAKRIIDKIAFEDAINVLDKFCIFLCNCKQNDCFWYSEGWVMNKLSAIKTYLEIKNPTWPWANGDNNEQYAKIRALGEKVI